MSNYETMGEAAGALQKLNDDWRHAKQGGIPAAEFAENNAERIAAIMASSGFLAILVKVLPVALPLVINIFRQMKEGKTFIEVIVENIDEIIAVVMSLLQVFDVDDSDPIGPEIDK